MSFLIKVILSAFLIASIAEAAKRSAFAAAVIASLPLTSIVAMIWLYADSGDELRIAELSRQIFWLVIPSLAFFPILSTFLEHGCNFWLALGFACLGTSLSYGLTLFLLRFFQ